MNTNDKNKILILDPIVVEFEPVGNNFYVRGVDGKKIASASFSSSGHISCVSTVPMYRGVGLQKHIFQAIESYAKMAEIPRIYLEVDTTNVPAVTAYEKAGFVFVKKNHNVEIEMHKILDENAYAESLIKSKNIKTNYINNNNVHYLPAPKKEKTSKIFNTPKNKFNFSFYVDNNEVFTAELNKYGFILKIGVIHISRLLTEEEIIYIINNILLLFNNGPYSDIVHININSKNKQLCKSIENSLKEYYELKKISNGSITIKIEGTDDICIVNNKSFSFSFKYSPLDTKCTFVNFTISNNSNKTLYIEILDNDNFNDNENFYDNFIESIEELTHNYEETIITIKAYDNLDIYITKEKYFILNMSFKKDGIMYNRYVI